MRYRKKVKATNISAVGARRASRSRRGMIAALVAVCLVAVMIIAAIALDGGRILDARRLAKAATDSAARGAAVEMLDMKSGANASANLNTVRATAFRLASDNGFTNDGTNSIVTVNTPPASGAYVGQDGFIEVIIEYKLDRGFSRLLGSDRISAVARSVAGGTYVPTKASVVLLDPKEHEALKLGGNSTSLTVEGDIAVNSKNHGGVKLDDNTLLTADNVMLSSSMAKGDFKKVKGTIRGQLHTQVPATPDPYLGLPIPNPGPTRHLNNYKTSLGGSDMYNLQPGKYTEDWNFDNNDVVNLAPGTYYLDNKHIDLHGNASMVGNGVTIYSSGDQTLKFSSTGAIQLSAPTSGTLTGVVLFKSPTAKGKIEFKRDTNMSIEGSIYAPKAEVKFKHMDESDSANVTIAADIVCRKLKVEDHSAVTITGSNLNIQRPFLGLVE